MSHERRSPWRMALMVGLAVLLGGCDAGPNGKADESLPVLLAEVNGEPITRADLQVLLMAEGKRSGSWKVGTDALRPLVETLIERRLMLQRYRELGEPVPESRLREYEEIVARHYRPRALEEVLREEGIQVEEWRRAISETLAIEHLLVREVYSRVRVTDQEIETHYRKNQESYRLGRRWRVRQIVVETEEQARRIREFLIAGTSFDRLAREKSIGPERHAGGDIGFYSRGQLPESIEGVVRNLEGEEVSRVVHTSSGYHIFQVTERRSGGLQSLGLVREQIQGELAAQKGREYLSRWISDLRSEANIRYHWRSPGHAVSG